MPVIFPVILSGGAGTRLWPLSRSLYPKQFISALVDNSENLFEVTASRLRGDRYAAPTVISNNAHRFLVRNALKDAGIDPRAILLEPVGRNTAPAIAAAAHHVVAENADAILVVMPSDHVIRDQDAFVAAIELAADAAAQERLVLFGITPDQPNTGYGYIRMGPALTATDGKVHEVQSFHEKPELETAKHYLESGEYFWNSGIFILHARTFLDQLAEWEPEVHAKSKSAVAKAGSEDDFLRLEPDAFLSSPSISVDYAVMERTEGALMIPLDPGWSDVGSWSSLWELAEKDESGNACSGDTILHDTKNAYVRSEHGLVATLGLEDVIVVNTPDALLVADKSRAQDVSALVGQLRDDGRSEQEQHVRNTRPWGYFETLTIGPRFQVKKLHVVPGGKLSMQMHHHRSEHWVVVQGTAQVTVGNEVKLLQENEIVYIPVTEWHRLENPGKGPLEIIEVQTGTYFGEDDIVRGDDIYNRAPDETR
ncbi:MAG: mannose-1-phosphate guanylyltransferase/mannose-6-phosphate isomerase [Hyphomicrobiaceae bacterium]